MDQAYESILKSNRSALIYAATRFMAIKRISACVVEVPETDPQQYVVAGTPEQIAGLLPEAGIKPARRKDDVRPTEPLSFEDDAAAVPPVVLADVATPTRYNPNDSTRHYADFPEGPMLEARAGQFVKFADLLALLAAPAAPAVTVSPAPHVEDRDDLLNAVVDAANAYLEASIDPGIMVGLKDRQTFVGIGTKATFTMLCDGRSGRQLEEAAHLARQAQPTDRDSILEEAAQACEREAVTVETWRPYNGEQEARNGGVEDCAAAIRALKGKSGEGAADAN